MKISASHLWPAQGILKGESGLFLTRVNAMGWRPYCPSRMEVSYCTFRFGVIIRPDLRILSLPWDSLCDNQYACMIWVHAGMTINSRLMKLFGGVSYKKIRRYNNSPPYVMARWPPQQIPPLNLDPPQVNGRRMLYTDQIEMLLVLYSTWN